jgi:hypothetical protein
MGTSRFTVEQVRLIFEIEAPRIYRRLRLDRYVTKPDVYKYAATRRLWALWLEAWSICEYNIPPNIESLTHEELQEEMYRRFGRQADGYELVYFVRRKPGETNEQPKET